MRALLHSTRQPLLPPFALSVALHVLVVFGVGFAVDLPQQAFKTLAVTVSLTPAVRAPVAARHVSAQNQLGELDAGEQAPVTEVVMQTSLTLSREMPGEGDGVAQPLPEQQSPQSQGANQAARSDLSAQPTRVGAVAARRALDANYLARWRARVEQMGNALYRGEPPAGNGDVRLLVTVLADGSLENIRVLQSSGISELDQAAQDTVVLSAPFPAFSRELAQHTPRLDIIRTWQFRTHAVSSANTTPE